MPESFSGTTRNIILLAAIWLNKTTEGNINKTINPNPSYVWAPVFKGK
jgi:hypothetical protein